MYPPIQVGHTQVHEIRMLAKTQFPTLSRLIILNDQNIGSENLVRLSASNLTMLVLSEEPKESLFGMRWVFKLDGSNISVLKVGKKLKMETGRMIHRKFINIE